MLINEPQWIGIIVKPINYSLKNAVLHIDTGPGLKIDDLHLIEMESYTNETHRTSASGNSNDDAGNSCSPNNKSFERLKLQDSRIEFPDWASNISSILWIPIQAIKDELARGSSSGHFNIYFFLVIWHVSTPCINVCLFLCVCCHSYIVALTIFHILSCL